MGIVFASIIVIGLLIEKLAYTSSKITCGRIIRQSSIRGAWSIYYVFKVEGETIEGGVGTSYLKNIPLDSLKKIECVQIEYSTWGTSFNRVVDKRLLK